MLSFNVLDDYIYAGVNAGGVWKYAISNLVGIHEENLINSDAILSQNFPNPFNPSIAGRYPTTTIEFSIQDYSKIELSILNIKEQKIKTLADNDFYKGTYSTIWDGSDNSGNIVS